MWSDPSPSMLYSTQSIHKFFMCVLFETRSKSSLCPCQLKNLWTELLTYLIQIFGIAAQTIPNPTIILIYSPTISHDLHFSVCGWHMSREWEGSGARSSKFFGQTVFHRGYIYPLPFFTSLLLCSSFSNPSAAATSSSPVRKSFTASTSSPSYSRRLRISSLRRRRSCLPQPS